MSASRWQQNQSLYDLSASVSLLAIEFEKETLGGVARVNAREFCHGVKGNKETLMDGLCFSFIYNRDLGRTKVSKKNPFFYGSRDQYTESYSSHLHPEFTQE